MDPQQQPSGNPQNTTPGASPSQFTSNEPPKANKNGLIVAIIVIVLVIAGIVAFAMTKSGKDDSGKTSNNSSSSDANGKDAGGSDLQKYDVTDKSGIKFAVSFYKNAKVEEKNGRTFLNAGEEGSMSSVYLTTGKTGQIDCSGAKSTTMKLNGQSTTVCYRDDNTQYGGFVTTEGVTVQLNVAAQKGLSIDQAKAILESADFNATL